MGYTLIKDLFGRELTEAREITVGGWIRTMRVSKTFAFMELNDGTCFANLQVVIEGNAVGNDIDYNNIIKFGEGSAVTVTGQLVPTPGMKQPFELKARNVALEGGSPSDYPMQKKRHTMEYLRTQAHLRPRTNVFSAVFRIRSLASFAIHRFFNERGFMYVHTPIITGSDCEGAGEMFQLTTLDLANAPKNADGSVDFSKDFFGKPANLTVSGQLNAECMAMAYRNVYTFGPTFRAEYSFTTRHAAEFWMVEPEIAFADLNDDMNLAEDLLKYILAYVIENAPAELAFLSQYVDKGLLDRLIAVRDSNFARMTYTEAIERLQKSGKDFEYPPEWGCDIQTEHERYLAETVCQGPVFVTDYPKEIKSFYMRLNDDGKTVAATDLMVPGIGELIGASQREERLDVLTARMAELGLKQEDYWWYLELRKYGSVKHAGFGIGFERLVMYLTGIGNIRDSIPFPRTAKNAEF